MAQSRYAVRVQTFARADLAADVIDPSVGINESQCRVGLKMSDTVFADLNFSKLVYLGPCIAPDGASPNGIESIRPFAWQARRTRPCTCRCRHRAQCDRPPFALGWWRTRTGLM